MSPGRTVDERVTSAWQICRVAPDSVRTPADLEDLAWTSVPPGARTVAAALRHLGTWSLDQAGARRFDAEEWWWRTTLPARQAPTPAGAERFLCLDGLATLATVWLDDTLVLESENMFVAHRLRLPDAGGGEVAHRLVIRFAALDARLAQRRPRPRWRTPMIEHQQLRWIRTTLLGRTPGWSPPAAPVGPWRGVRVERLERGDVELEVLGLRTEIGADGAGHATLQATVRVLADGAPAARLTGAELVLARGGVLHRSELVVTPAPGDAPGIFALTGAVTVPEVALWWPHTHGTPALYDAHLALRRHGPLTRDGAGGARGERVSLGRVGFRTLALDRTDAGTDAGAARGFALLVNGVRVFCRGACWTPLDCVSLDADGAALTGAFEQLVRAGMNMLRVGGTMVYESDAFYDACDAHGILVWHDLMFANMDYPEDATFTASVHTEVGQFLARMQGRPGLAVLCGSSEGEQQAAMWGAPRERWSPTLFHTDLAGLCRTARPDVPYWPSSAHGGAFPHQASAGTTSYYGVGAYLRPIEDARRAEVRFASECLAFANVPDASGLPGGPERASTIRPHHPEWKARTPRDLGAGWDFDDVREHYLGTVYRLDPLAVRYANPERHLALARACTGEVMAAVFGEWRRRRSSCAGGLVWFLRDLWAGAGWGVVDATGNPKAAWWYLRRALAPLAVHLSDEGVNGLAVHLVNDRPESLRPTLELGLFRGGEHAVGSAAITTELPAHGALELAAGELFDGFLDLSYAYRFGPPAHDLVVATLTVDGEVRAQAFHFPLGIPSASEAELGLTAEVHAPPDAGAPGVLELVLRTRRFAQSVAVEVEGFLPDDSWFHLPPGGTRTVRLTPTGDARDVRGIRGWVRPLNADRATAIVTVASGPGEGPS